MISAVILTRNNDKTINKVLESLNTIDEIIIYDTGSTDQTLEIAKNFYNVKIFSGKLNGFGPTRNMAALLAKNDWILAIDSDEVLSKELTNEILKINFCENSVYSLPFHNYFNERFIKWCGWYPEEHIRLYNRKKTQFSPSMVHEGIETRQLKIKYLKNPVYHFSYHCLSDFLSKMQSYSDLFAEQYKGKRKSSPWIAIGHGMGAFFKSFIIKKGFLGGYEGFIISIYNGHTAFYKYLKLFEINNKN